jgi:hypothetical protein
MNRSKDNSWAGKGSRRKPAGKASRRVPTPQRESLLAALRLRRAGIRVRWIELLFVEPVNSPLANPQTMTFMLDQTLDEVFQALQDGESPRAAKAPQCECGLNPYLAYYRAGVQALHEALVWAQAEAGKITPAERDRAFVELDSIIRRIAGRDIETFASLCQERHLRAAGMPRPESDRAAEF